MFEKLFILLFLALNLCAAAYGAAGSIAICPTGKCATQCGRVFGGEGIDRDSSVVEMKDGGYLVVGSTNSFGNAGSAWLVKIDSKGNKVWDRAFGGKRRDAANSIAKTADGGFVVAGSGFSEKSMTNDFKAVKLDSMGNQVWEAARDDVEGNEYSKAVAPTSDGGCIIGGNRLEVYYKDGPKPRDAAVMKLDASGRRDWAKRFGSKGVIEDVNSIRQTSDGGYVVVGSSGKDIRLPANNGVWVFKLDASGNEEWSKVLEGTGQNFISSVVQAPDGGYYLTGFTSAPKDQGELWVLRLSSSGNPEWEELYGDSGREEAISIEGTSDGGYIVAGFTTSSNEGILLRLDAGGYVAWVKTYGGNGKDILRSARETSDGGFIASGFSDSFGARNADFWVMKVDAKGNCVW